MIKQSHLLIYIKYTGQLKFKQSCLCYHKNGEVEKSQSIKIIVHPVSE